LIGTNEHVRLGEGGAKLDFFEASAGIETATQESDFVGSLKHIEPYIFEPFSIQGENPLYEGNYPAVIPMSGFWKGIGIIAKEKKLKISYDAFQDLKNWYMDMVCREHVVVPDFVVSNPALLRSFEIGYGENHTIKYCQVGVCTVLAFPWDPVLVGSWTCAYRVECGAEFLPAHQYSDGVGLVDEEDNEVDPPDVMTIPSYGVSSFLPINTNFVQAALVHSLDFFIEDGKLYGELSRPYSELSASCKSKGFFVGYSFEANGPRVLSIDLTLYRKCDCSRPLVLLTKEIFQSYEPADQRLVFALLCGLRSLPSADSRLGVAWPMFSGLQMSSVITLPEVEVYLEDDESEVYNEDE